MKLKKQPKQLNPSLLHTVEPLIKDTLKEEKPLNNTQCTKLYYTSEAGPNGNPNGIHLFRGSL